MESKIHIGTSGWSYKDWIEKFYPEKLKRAEWITFYSQTFSCTEINSSFYRIPKRETVENWVKKVPPEFFFCPKLSRYITHIKRLHEPEEALNHFFDVFEPMKNKMGPVLIQLPPSLKFNGDTVEHLFKVLEKKYRHYYFALEGRHTSWLENESINLMKDYNIAFVISHSGHEFPYGEFVTSKNIYIRFHGPEKLFASLYGKNLLQKFARMIKKWQKENNNIWAFFNNDFHGYAIQNARQLMKLLKLEAYASAPFSSLHTNKFLL